MGDTGTSEGQELEIQHMRNKTQFCKVRNQKGLKKENVSIITFKLTQLFTHFSPGVKARIEVPLLFVHGLDQLKIDLKGAKAPTFPVKLTTLPKKLNYPPLTTCNSPTVTSITFPSISAMTLALHAQFSPNSESVTHIVFVPSMFSGPTSVPSGRYVERRHG